MKKVVCIIGSGPTGVIAAKRLLERGAAVCLLDGGLTLENERRETLDQAARLNHSEWSDETIRSIKGEMRATAAGIPMKLAYGSDYPYREAERIFAANKAVGVTPSLARGGFSNVWGGAMMPYLPADTTDWAIKITDLAEHYRAAVVLTGLAAREDNLSRRFPLYGEPHDCLPTSRHIENFLCDLSENAGELERRGIIFGRSRLAVAKRNQHGFGCAACTMCMYGCPYELIFNTANVLPELRRNPDFDYRSNVIVERFRETVDGVEVFAKDRLSGEALTFRADRLLVGAGVLSTARMILESLEARDETIVLKDSQYFLLPLLRFAQTPEAEIEAQHTLAQAFIEIFDDNVSDKSIHLQIYGYNELYRQAIENKIRPFQKLTANFTGAFLRRFVLIQGYLHSDYSHTVRLRLGASDNNQNRLEMEVVRNPLTDKTLNKLIKKLLSVRALTRAVPLKLLLQKGTIGRGYHTGGSFPMRAAPRGKFETDVLGRLAAWQKIHLIDASVFPSVPASTITLTAMANARRIASEIEI